LLPNPKKAAFPVPASPEVAGAVAALVFCGIADKPSFTVSKTYAAALMEEKRLTPRPEQNHRPFKTI